MAIEGNAYAVGSKNITALIGSNASEALTTREILCQSVLLLPVSGNTGIVYIVDPSSGTIRNAIPTGGLTIPIQNPASILVAAATSGDDVEWYAV